MCYSNLQKKLLAHQASDPSSRGNKEESPLDDAIEKHARQNGSYSYAVGSSSAAGNAFGRGNNFGQGQNHRGLQQFE